MCGRKMTIDEDWLDTEFRGYVWFCECGNEVRAFRHVHTRNCYDDSGHGPAYLVCGKTEGEFEYPDESTIYSIDCRGGKCE
jgi:hypothetical protein